jgi:hypothetical protein
MPSRIADHLNAARRHQFVGREAERAIFQAALTAESWPFFILYIFGPGGVGKTTLLQELAALCRQHEIAALSLDARNVDPSPPAFILALQLTMGLGPETAPLDALAAQPVRSVIFIDTYEKLNPLDGWLREVFLPQLPENVLLVMAGREALSTGWRTDPGWNTLFRALPLRNLSPEESRAYLSQRRVSPVQHQSVLDFTRGHPLALSLVADVIDQRQDQQFVPEEAPDTIKTLLERFVQKVPSPAHRTALEASALLHVTTEPVLAELLQVGDAHELFEWLRSLSFIEYGKDGLFPHDLVRDVLATELRWRNPDWYAELHHRARAYYVKRMQQTHGEEQRRTLFGYIYLHRMNPVVRPVYDWQESGNVWTDAARESDIPALLAMLNQYEGEESARVAKYWFDRHLPFVQVFRSGQETPAGFLVLLTLDRVSDEMLRDDAALGRAWTYLQNSATLRSGEKLMYMRFWMAAETYQSHSPTQSRIFINVVQHYFSTPGLAFTFLAFAQPEAWEKVMAYADFARLPEADFEIGGRRYGVYGHDWRATPLMAWLDLMAAREISQEQNYSPALKASPTVVLSEPDFAAAVHEALRAYTRPDTLRNSPLLHSHLVIEPAKPEASQAERIARLIDLIHGAAKSLESSPREAKLYRVLHRTYFNPAESQELAADSLHLSFSTYRRYLKAAIMRVTEILWHKEINT